MDLRGKVAILTGGKRIGADVARELAASGASVALAYHRSRAETESTAADVRAVGVRALPLAADLRLPADCEKLVRTTVEELGRVDVLVNMASVYVSKPFDELTHDDFTNGLATDLTAAFLCARAAVAPMRKAGGGRIINVTDWTAASHRPRYKGYLPYYVAKAGVVALTEALALELAADGILVNAIAPGPILAPPGLGEDERRAIEESTPLGRWGGAGEIAKAVLWLIDSDFVTGETLRVDGGRHVV